MINFADANILYMERIKLHDKYFKPFISNKEIIEAIEKIALKLNNRYKNRETPIFLAVLNGSFMFAAHLLERLQFNCEISFIRLSSYSGTASTGKVCEVFGLDLSVKGRDVIIIEDIVDTGNTVAELFRILTEKGAEDIGICTLLFKPKAYKKDLKVEYAAISIPNDFIVGFGLDYNELGRQYKDIYVLDES